MNRFYYFNKLLRINLNVSEKNNKIPHKEVKLIEGLEKNDIGYKIIPRNLSNLDYLDDGFSTFGSSYESRNSSYTSWFSEDTFDQNNIYSDTNIKRLVISNNRATHIEVENGSNSKKIAVNKVILSAGALNTPKILMDSGYSNKQLGKNLKLHPVSGVAGKYSEEQKPWDGSMQGFYSDKFSMFIFDRWGNLVFESLKLNVGWNGLSSKNEECQSGVYVYKIVLEEKIDESNRAYIGNITLVR